MLISLKRNMSLIAMFGLLSLILTSCMQSNGTQDGQGSNPQATAAPVASRNTNMGMSNMNMATKPTPTASQNMQKGTAANQVIIENFSFAPATLTVKAGTK